MVGANGFLGCMTELIPAAKKGTLPVMASAPFEFILAVAARYASGGMLPYTTETFTPAFSQTLPPYNSNSLTQAFLPDVKAQGQSFSFIVSTYLPAWIVSTHLSAWPCSGRLGQNVNAAVPWWEHEREKLYEQENRALAGDVYVGSASWIRRSSASKR